MSSNVQLYLCPASPVLTCGTSLTASGNVNVNGNATFYLAGTTTPANTFTANGFSATGTLNPNPMQLGDTGRLANQVWQQQGQAIKVVITDAQGNVLDTDDNLLGIDDPSFGSSQANNAWNTANAAYTQANTATTIGTNAYRQANAAYAAANIAANTVAVYTANGLTLAAGNLTFNNSATVNANVVANGTFGTNIAFVANLAGLNVVSAVSSSNGYANLSSNLTMQWGVVQKDAAATGTAVTFPAHFQVVCYGVQLSWAMPNGIPGYTQGLAAQPTTSGFSVSGQAFGSSPPDYTILVYWTALGN